MEMISNYYSNYIKGAYYTKSKNVVQIRLGADYLKEALKIKQTEEAYQALLICYLKLQENAEYEHVLFEAVDNGFDAFYSSCGIYYANSKEKYDKDKALFWFKKGMNLKNARCYSELSKLYITGCLAFKPDREKGVELLKKGLELNDPKWNGYFSWALGLAYYEDKKYDEALVLYQNAIDAGYQQANYNLAILYRDGAGVEKDPEKYVQYLLKHLSPESALEIAGVYLLNTYAKADTEIACIYLDYAARQGNPVGAIMSAAFLVTRKQYDEKLLNQYLEIAFRNGVNDENMKAHFDDIEDVFGEDVKKKLQDLATKYWNLTRGQA